MPKHPAKTSHNVGPRKVGQIGISPPAVGPGRGKVPSRVATGRKSKRLRTSI